MGKQQSIKTAQCWSTMSSRTGWILSHVQFHAIRYRNSLQSQRYHSILLRYWREDETVVWRYVVQDLATGEQYSFADWNLLIAFLYQHMESQDQ